VAGRDINSGQRLPKLKPDRERLCYWAALTYRCWKRHQPDATWIFQPYPL